MIKEIAIQNFKSIKELKLDLKPINVLIGPNGAGKSNFVSFFSFVYAIYDKQLTTYTSDKGGADRVLHLGRRVSQQLGGRLNFSDINRYAFWLSPNEQNSFFFSDEYDEYNLSKGDVGYSGWSMDSYGRGHIESKLHDLTSPRVNYVKKYLESFRVYHFHNTSKSAPLKQTARVDDNRFLRSDGSNIAAFLYKLQQENALVYNRIEAVIKLIAPYFERFDLQPNGNFIRLNWRQKNTDIYLDASDLSDGTIRFIALCTLLLQPQLPETILIDEPELGLHPYAITILAELIQGVAHQKKQLIMSTQSVNLIDKFSPDDIIVVDNVANESRFRRLDEQSLEAWLEEYSIGELWNKNVLGGNP
ncbi:AAA family ATPase [Spirosoma areae]